jgi:hypothetical protein
MNDNVTWLLALTSIWIAVTSRDDDVALSWPWIGISSSTRWATLWNEPI